MYRLFPIALFTLVLFSCGGSEEENASKNNEQDTTAVDTLVEDTLVIEEDPNRPKIDVDALLAKSGQEFVLPMNIDSNFVAEWSKESDAEYDLSWKEAKYLSYDFLDNEATSMAAYDVSTFIKLDSIRDAGEDAWEAYQNSIDLGMARYANGYVVGTILVNDVSEILVWATDYATYEACPYGYGTCVFGTLFTKGIGLNTVVLGEISGGGDPPSWGRTLVTSDITPVNINVFGLSQWGEEDYESGEEILESTESVDTVFIQPRGMLAE